MRHLVFALVSLLLASETIHAAPKFFLTPQRLRRLQRERERQTQRWVNFENRVKTVPDSPERGFELALYSVISGDEDRGREAVRWDKEHTSCDSRRQSLLIQNWLGDEPYAEHVASQNDCGTSKTGEKQSIPDLRDKLMAKIAAGEKSDPAATAQVIQALEGGAYREGPALYAAMEFLSLMKAATRRDPREASPRFFIALPSLLLLGLKPSQIEDPEWQTHAAALALVSLDPNSDGGQFLQGWAIEDRHMLRDGPGVAYELLWADPYLPSVGYQNLDPWTLEDDTGTLLARADWTAQACWIRIAAGGSDSVNCPSGWETKTTNFGHLRLVPFSGKCVDITHSPSESIILSRLAPGQKVRYTDGGSRKEQSSDAGPAGLWRVPVTATGKACASR